MLKTLKNILKWVGRERNIYDQTTGDLYLTRYYLFLENRTIFPFNIFLHQFHKSDDPILHDHPWNYITIIVKGGYWEYVLDYNEHGHIIGEKKLWRGAGHIRRCPAESYHRIEIEPGVDCWTIFIPGIKRREWGFIERDDNWSTLKWIPNEQYTGLRNNGR